MFGWLTQKPKVQRTAIDLYGRVVAAARQPIFYRDLGVRDTTEGRFEMVALHLFLALEGFKAKTTPDNETRHTAITQSAIEAFVIDMDDCMREMGVGDLTVPKKVKRAAAGFYERAGAYRNALADINDASLVDVLKHYIDFAPTSESSPSTLAAYVRSTHAEVSHKTIDDIFTDTHLSTLFPMSPARSG
ncbi:MAG: ubiquinol-cytochrome C chaperone [Hyphomicrobium sp.]|nr:MAG: ubiquinol-cytochrome C chaperone [Hyphomicrobium sp.]PPC98532.1 MAG: ubiquinol-cytochrome C chaperone [Hyphomicrobium sp.]